MKLRKRESGRIICNIAWKRCLFTFLQRQSSRAAIFYVLTTAYDFDSPVTRDLKIKVSYIIVVLTSKLQNGVGFSNLTGALDDQRFSVFAVLPLL